MSQGGALSSTTATPRVAVVAGVGLVAIVTLVARFAAFARWPAFAYPVGATCVGTVYQAANTVPTVLFEVAAGGALAAVVVPLIAGAIGRGRLRDAHRIGAALLTWTVLLLVPVSILVALLAGPLGGWLTRDDPCPGAADLAATMLRWFAPQVVLFGVGIVLGGILQAHRRHLAAAVASLAASLVVIGAYTAYGRMVEPATRIPAVSHTAVVVLAGGTTLGVAALSLPLLVPVWRANIRLRPTLRFPLGTARRVRALGLAGLLALVGQQFALVAGVVVANRSQVGLLNVLTYVQAACLLPYALLVLPVAVSAFPALTVGEGTGPLGGGSGDPEVPTVALRRVDRHLSAPQNGMLAWSARAALLLGAAGAGLLAAVARPLGELFASLDAGRYTPAGREVLAAMPMGIWAFAPGVVGLALSAVLTRALYARGRPYVAGAAGAAGWVIAGGLPLALVMRGSTPSTTLLVLGTASTIGMTLAATELTAATRRAWGRGALTGLGRTALVAVGAAGLGAAAGILATYWWTVTGVWASAGQVCCVAVVAGLVILAGLRVGDRQLTGEIAGGIRSMFRRSPRSPRSRRSRRSRRAERPARATGTRR